MLLSIAIINERGVYMPLPAAVIAIGKVVGAAAGTFVLSKVLPKVVDEVSDAATKSHERRQNWIKVPNVIGARLSDAQSSITTIGLNSLPIEVKPRKEYKEHKAETVIKSSHKADVKVDPTTTINLYYITQDVIDESKRLAEEHETKKVNYQKERKEKIKNLHHHTKNSLQKIRLKKKESDG